MIAQDKSFDVIEANSWLMTVTSCRCTRLIRCELPSPNYIRPRHISPLSRVFSGTALHARSRLSPGQDKPKRLSRRELSKFAYLPRRGKSRSRGGLDGRETRLRLRRGI